MIATDPAGPLHSPSPGGAVVSPGLSCGGPRPVTSPHESPSGGDRHMIDRAALRDALADLRGRDFLVPTDLAEQGLESWQEVIAAARFAETLLPDECVICEGMMYVCPVDCGDYPCSTIH